jgi:hypothetical protein
MNERLSNRLAFSSSAGILLKLLYLRIIRTQYVFASHVFSSSQQHHLLKLNSLPAAKVNKMRLITLVKASL